MHFQDQPHFCSQVKLPKPQIFLISQDLNYVFMCCSSTQKYSVLFEANTLKRSQLMFSFHPCAQLFSTPLNALSVHSMSWPWCCVCTTRLSVYSWCPDLNTGVPRGLWPKLSFWIAILSAAVRKQFNQFFTQLHSTPTTGAPCKAVVYSLGSLILFTWFSQMSRDAWLLRNKITRSYNLKT